MAELRLGIYMPSNIRMNNAFYTGEHPVFKYLKDHYGYNITYFCDDQHTIFKDMNVHYVDRHPILDFPLRLLRKLIYTQWFYWKVPYYGIVPLNEYDVIITEGIHYPLLAYCCHVGHKTILNDSITTSFTLFPSQVKYLHLYFGQSPVVTVNNKIPELYRRNGLKLRTITIPHAIDLQHIPFVQRTHCRGKAISIGRLVPEKGYEYTIRAIASIKDRYPDLTLEIFGDGPLRESLIELIEELGLTNRIFLRPSLPYETLMSNLSNYDLFISHPIEMSYIAEAFLMANVEAMAAGIPVITSDCGGVPSVVGQQARVVEQRQEKQIAQTISDLLDFPDQVTAMSISGRLYVEKSFAVEIVAAAWNQVIQGVVSRHKNDLSKA